MLLLLASLVLQDGPPNLDDRNLKTWMDFVRPTPEDAAWERLGWRTELAAAADEAKSLRRPLLLWAMNGHPCGLT